LLTDQLVGELKDNLVEFKGQQFIDVDLINIDVLLNKFRLNNADDPKNAGRIYIIDPRGNLMMSYAPNVNPKDVYKDLKKLLRGSRIG
jgi:cytochrome oxidase Cu insertion factor (SCO1/SenC/PrrC family)